jgi:hypothetical protein
MLKLPKNILLLLTILLIASCNTLKPYQYIYEIKDNTACYYKTVQDLAQNKNIQCKPIDATLNGWKIIHPDNLKELTSKAIEEMTKSMYQSQPQE